MSVFTIWWCRTCTKSDIISQFDLKGALKRALGGGLSGAAAMFLQVLLLMVWDSLTCP